MFKLFLKNDKGEAYVGEAVKIVIAIVLGAALLAGAVLVFHEVVLPKVEQAIEWGFGNAGEKVEEIDSVYNPILAYMQKGIDEQLGGMTEDEWADFELEVNETYEANPEAFPSGFKTEDIKDAETFMNICYAANEGLTYNEAVAFSATKEGKTTYAEYFDGWFAS